MDIDKRLRKAIQHFWKTRDSQSHSQGAKTGQRDAGARSATPNLTPRAHPLTFPFMRWFAPCLLLILLTGCASKPFERDSAEVTMFGPTRMRLHPIFTQVKDWTGGGHADGVEAEVEFQDQFDDPTKAAGRVMFELFSYRQGYPDPRGERIVNPWVGSLLSLQQQQEHWNRTSRTYSFQLAMPGISTKRTYVLTAMFEHNDGRRFFSRVILKGFEDEPRSGRPLPILPEPTTRPVLP